MSLLIQSLLAETEEDIFNLLDGLDLIRLRCVSYKLKCFVDEAHNKWIPIVANLSFFHLHDKCIESITDNATWCDVYCALRNPANANLTDEFNPLPKHLNFFGETLTKVESPQLQQASNEYLFLWSDYLGGCGDSQCDNYFINISLYKRPQNAEKLPFDLNGEKSDAKTFQSQFEAFACSAVSERLYAFHFRSENVLASQLSREISANVISNPHKISVLEIFLNKRNFGRTGARIYAGRSFLASTRLRNFMHNMCAETNTTQEGGTREDTNTTQDGGTCEENKSSTQPSSVIPSTNKQNKSIPYMVVDSLYNTRQEFAYCDDFEDSNTNCGAVFKNEDFDATVLLPENIHVEKKQNFMTDLQEVTAGVCHQIKERILEYSKPIYPDLKTNVEGLACLSNSKLTELGELWHSAKLQNISKALKKTGLMEPFEGNYYYELALTDCDRLVEMYYDGVYSNDHQDACAVAIIAKDAVMIVAFHSDRC